MPFLGRDATKREGEGGWRKESGRREEAAARSTSNFALAEDKQQTRVNTYFQIQLTDFKYPCSSFQLMKVSFSLNKTKATTAAPSASLKPTAAFASFDDDEPLDAAPTASGSGTGALRTDVNKKLAAQSSGHLSKTLRKRLEEELKVDQTVFEYDEVYDKIQEAKQRQKEKKEVDSQQKKVKTLRILSTACGS